MNIFLHREVFLGSEAPDEAFGSLGNLWGTFLKVGEARPGPRCAATLGAALGLSRHACASCLPVNEPWPRGPPLPVHLAHPPHPQGLTWRLPSSVAVASEGARTSELDG